MGTRVLPTEEKRALPPRHRWNSRRAVTSGPWLLSALWPRACR